MNEQGVERLEIDDGDSVQAIDIDSGKPFAIVLPVNAGTVTFYGADEEAVPFWEHPL